MALSTYYIYARKNLDEAEAISAISTPYNNNVQVVASGFSFWAFIFNIFWLAYNRLWVLLIAISVFFMLLTLSAVKLNFLSLEQVNLIRNFVFLFIALEADSLKEYSLVKHNYVLIGIISAFSKDDAIKRYLDNN
jgi:hypothetical protein